MRIVFMGSPDFATPLLRALHDGGHEIVAVYSQPPRPAGRGKKPRPTPVHKLAEELGIPVHTPRSLKSAGEQARFAALKADAGVVAAYGLILPGAVLEAPRYGCFNLHASLLPRWRGAAPIHRAVMAGDETTGVCVMKMDEGLDTGDVCSCAEVPISESDTTGDVHDRLARTGAALMLEAMNRLEENGELECRAQPREGVTYAEKISKAEARIDFSQPARRVLARIHGLSPWPGAWLELPGAKGPERVKILRAELAEGAGAAGEILDDDLTIACGRGAIRPLIVQPAGKGAMTRETFLRGRAIAPGTRIEGA